MVGASGERAVGVGGDVRNVATGDYVQQIGEATVLPAEAFVPVGELGKRLVKLPVPTRLFVGRERELALLDGASSVVCVHGLGGIGKSTLVARWARAGTAARNPVWWITADSPAAIEAGLTELGVAMQPELAEVLPQQALRERALQWLATHDGWLIVLDNVSDPADVEPLLERAPGGRFVITSRRATGWHGTAASVDMDVLDTEHAAELFGRICPAAGTAGVSELVRELGNLPLAVEQAAAFCKETGTPAERYLQMLATYPADMFAASAEGGDPERTVARVWRVTLDRLAEGDPTPVFLLYVLAWFAPEGIPRNLLEPVAENAPAYARAVGRLAAHSMISVQGDTLSVHRLVQALARTPGGHVPGDPDVSTAARDLAIRALNSTLPDGHEAPGTWHVWRSLIPHVEALADHLEADQDTGQFARVLNGAGAFLVSQLNGQRAARLLDRAHTACVRLLGPEDPRTLMVLNNLASAHLVAGDLSATALLERAFEDSARVLGKEDPGLAALLTNLGYAHSRAGDWKASVRLHARSLHVLLRTVGSDDPRTLQVRCNFLNALTTAGEPGKAVPLLRQLVEDCVRIHGEAHQTTLFARNNLAGALRESGEVDQAIELMRRIVDDRARALGELHPQTLLLLTNLARMYYLEGRTDEAAVIFEQALDSHVRTLGEDHPETRRLRKHLQSLDAAGPPE